ncbi:MAG: DNA mismatch repair protein MutS [Acidaminococcales bacterium]|jgi:DNA mismatch repair protein MutS|nr:DNA mismatch repair protein MutS [Acidaminococcales bacterium]
MDNQNYTPMIIQYQEIKSRHPGEILFFRLGDFYEMFFDDAHLASRELDITLTSRDGGADERIPMCGVPYHSADGYIAKLIKKGYKIAICEQVEDPRDAKGLVKREVIKIITPGTAMNDQLLDEKTNQYLALLYEEAGCLAFAAADVSTGECLWAACRGVARREKALDLIFQIAPAEMVTVGKVENWSDLESFCRQKLPGCSFSLYCPEDLDGAEALTFKHFPGHKLPAEAKTAVGCLLSYLYTLLKSDLSHIGNLSELNYETAMLLDAAAARNLELLRNLRDGSRKGTLLDIIDFTQTAMGGRQLKRWIEAPLLNPAAIIARQQVIAELLGEFHLRELLKTQLAMISDMERILSRIEVGNANARDLAALSASLAALPDIRLALKNAQGGKLHELGDSLELHSSLRTLLFNALVDDPPFSVREGGMIREGYDLELDALRRTSRDSREWMNDFEAKQRALTGIKNLKVGYNKVFGYYIEITRSNLGAVPDNFVRKQTLANAERYIVPELKEFENRILGAQERIEQLEYYIFNCLREKVREHTAELQNTARALASVDVFLSLATAADKYKYIRPELNSRQEITIKDGRHPVVERLLRQELFVPNDVSLNMGDRRMLIITGPNMAGKSTYMRQIALLTLMAQIGCFIPARQACICPVDRIFTRVGASDDLASGQSTFMLEMTEVAQILNRATERSLIILDEVGRGTSTYDGMSIAQAVIEYINSKIGAKTLFATHYHELMQLESQLDGLRNCSVAVKEKGGEVVFLRRIVPGGADKSYGIHVAQLAGLPKSLLARAQRLLNEYSGETPTGETQKKETSPRQETLFAGALNRELLELDVAAMTPIEAMNKLYDLQKEAKKEAGIP